MFARLVGWFLLILSAYAQVPGPVPGPKVDPRRPDLPPAKNLPAPNADTEVKDPFRTGVQKVPTNVVIALGSTVTIAEMACEIHPWSHDTRSVTCGLSGSQPKYSGILKVIFTDKTSWSRSVTIEQPTNGGVMAVWGVCAIPIYGTKEVSQVEFTADGPDAVWEGTPAARAVLGGTYAYPQGTQYPPAVKIGEMQCHGSEFLIGKSQAEITPTYSVTCVLAGDQPYYGGYLALWFHQFDSRIAEANKPAPVSKAQSTRDTANHSQYVFVAHDMLENGMQYWGVAALLFESPVKIAIDRINFYPEREETTWAPPASTAGYPPTWSKPANVEVPYVPLIPALPAPPMSDYQKSFFVNRICQPYVSCLRTSG